MTGVKDLLRRRRKAELQTIHQFWYPGESRLSTRDELERRVQQALTGGVDLGDRVARLSRIQRSLLTTLLEQHPSYSAGVGAVQSLLERSGAARLEIESAARMLVERGFIDRVRPDPPQGANQDLFSIPSELAPQLAEAFDLGDGGGRVPPEHQLSQQRLPFEIDFESLSLIDRVATLEDPTLIKLVEIAIGERGIAEASNSRVQDLIDGDTDRLTKSDWRRQLEEAGIGTIGPVSLQDFGILVQQPAVIIFQEWMDRHYRAQLARPRQPDTVVESGVDLYIDVDRVASFFDANPVRLTRGGKIPKRVQESIKNVLCSPRLESFVEQDLTDLMVRLSQRIGIVESYMGEVRVDAERLQHWRKLDLIRQVEAVLERFMSDNQGARWSFHQEFLREIVIEVLKSTQFEDWVSFDAVIGLVISTYMLELEEREVRETLRERREEDFARERLNSPYARLASDLTYWMVHCFLPLGVCELGLCGGKLDSFRLTPLGKEVFGIPRESAESRILVNPDFEIMLFCEGLRGMRLELELSRFGERVSAERVRRYRVTRESMRSGIRSGLSLEEIRVLLDEASDYPLPDPVLVDLRDWGKDLDWIHVSPAIVLSGLDVTRREAVEELLAESEVSYQVCPDGTLVVTESENVDVAELLQEEGWLVRSPKSEAPALTLESASKRA